MERKSGLLISKNVVQLKSISFSVITYPLIEVFLRLRQGRMSHFINVEPKKNQERRQGDIQAGSTKPKSRPWVVDLRTTAETFLIH